MTERGKEGRRLGEGGRERENNYCSFGLFNKWMDGWVNEKELGMLII